MFSYRYVETRSDQWLQRLQNILEANPSAAVGEAGLHKSKGRDNVASMEEQVMERAHSHELECPAPGAMASALVRAC